MLLFRDIRSELGKGLYKQVFHHALNSLTLKKKKKKLVESLFFLQLEFIENPAAKIIIIGFIENLLIVFI